MSRWETCWESISLPVAHRLSWQQQNQNKNYSSSINVLYPALLAAHNLEPQCWLREGWLVSSLNIFLLFQLDHQLNGGWEYVLSWAKVPAMWPFGLGLEAQTDWHRKKEKLTNSKLCSPATVLLALMSLPSFPLLPPAVCDEENRL